MKPSRSVLILAALVLPLSHACDDADDVRASERPGGIGQTASDLAAEARNIDWSQLSDDMIVTRVRELSRDVADKLSEMRSEVEARELAQELEPVLDKLQAAKDRIGAQLPTMPELEQAARDLEERFAADADVHEAIQPLLDKIQALIE